MSDDRILEQLPEAISRLGLDLRVRGQNRESVERFGEAAGKPCHVVHFGRDERCPGCRVDEVLKHGRPGSWYLVDERSGQRVHHEVTVGPVLDPRGRVTELVEIVRDATVKVGVEQHLIRTSEELERQVARRAAELEDLNRRSTELREQLDALRRDQAALVHTEKMATVGRLAAGLTHELHTPLGALLSNLDLLGRCVKRARAALEAAGDDAPGAAALREQLEACRDLLELQRAAAQRIHRITHSLRNFAHLDRAEEEPYDLHEGIDSALALLTHEIRGRIEVVRDYGTLPRVLCRPDALNHVFMNLLENAVQAIDGPGKIRVATRTAGDGVEVVFEDSGRGIRDEDRERIFEPGFTTRPRGVGTGLGLAIARRTVADHGGSIEVRGRSGGGTVFTLRLPLRGGAA